MAGKSKELTVRSWISFEGKGGPYRPMDELTEEEIDYAAQKICEKIARQAKLLYENNPELFAKHFPDLMEEGEIIEQTGDDSVQSGSDVGICRSADNGNN